MKDHTLVLNKHYFPINVEEYKRIFTNIASGSQLPLDIHYEIDEEGTIKYLTEINDVLQAISNKGCGNSVPVYDLFGPVEAPRKVFVSDFDINSIPDVLEPCWNLFKANADKLIDKILIHINSMK